ncbi:hypothetical protein BTR14_18390 [Rhizobium rhizosphaerae]|uniref:Acyltransferase n=1 Tax=Xaviernesmea rhizosphaerae TaxID=1672749 RepID=A0ABX3PAC2_9HYPH|nr:acyltransferase [Xaviernesmea rhizosphaerae]OQP84602.1 hypothetical protein BTR14_18390 [Xaviernesmea rhizosphaerae]
MISVEDKLQENRWIGPGFNLLRHALALAILLHHCRVAVFGLFGRAELVKDESQPGMAVFLPKAAPGDSYESLKGTGLWAMDRMHLSDIVTELLRPGLFSLVGMFFVLSGFLVAGSAMRNSNIPSFVGNRVLRIVPALAVEVTLCALILGPIFTHLPLQDYLSNGQFFRYFGNILGHVTFELPGVFVTNPWPLMVNANLWTLPWELWCYVLMLSMMVLGLFAPQGRYRRAMSAIALVIILAMTLWNYLNPEMFNVRQDTTRFAGWYIVFLFLVGVYLRLIARHLPLHGGLFLVAAAAYYVMTVMNVLGPLSGVFLAYCTVYIGMMRFDWFDRIMKHDLSYGIYLYGFPITQMLVALIVPMVSGSRVVSFALIAPLVVVLTASFALISWIYIERPALRLRRLYQKPAL